MPRHEFDEMQALQELFDHIFSEGVGAILDTGSFAALHARLENLMRPLAHVVAGEADEHVDEGTLEQIARALATRAAIDLWNNTPIPDNGFRAHPPIEVERHSPCPCGSQRAFGQCCGVVDVPGLIFPPEEMLTRVLGHLPKERIGELAGLGIPPSMLGQVAEAWFDQQRYEDVVTLLTPLFDDVSRLDQDAELAADTLANALLELGDETRRQRLVAVLKRAPDKMLRSAGLQREAVMNSDRGDARSAWAAFNEALRLTPDNPALSHLEVLLLLAEGRDLEARARAEHWSAKLAEDPEQDHSDLIGLLHGIIGRGDVDERLAALPENFPERRLILRIELEDITPPIWRRLEVENTLTFGDLHLVLQAAMGWKGAHLYEFVVGEHRIGPTEDEPAWGEPTLPDEEIMIGQVLGRKKSFRYLYDFGDGWSHRITVEERLPSSPTERPAVLLAGERACPPEDCGGAPGYHQVLEALAHPQDDDCRETLAWLGSYDPEAFKIASMRKAVASLFRRI